MTREIGWMDHLGELDRFKVSGFLTKELKALVKQYPLKNPYLKARDALLRQMIGEIIGGEWDSTRPTRAAILARLNEIEDDDRYEPDPYKVAKVEINAPLALIQVGMETEEAADEHR
jgi:hypothetical protein